jgi:phosphoglycerol geranylgeranyltransferase
MRTEENGHSQSPVKERLELIFSGQKKSMAVLLDPDKCGSGKKLMDFLNTCEENGVDLILVGGSLISGEGIKAVVEEVKHYSDLPVLLFPAHPTQICEQADGILFLSLISGRQAEFLIGHHVVAAPVLARTNLEVIPTGYLLIDGGKTTTAHYMSNSMPIPRDKADVAVATALAGKYLGMKLIYMDAGSGALNPVPLEMITEVKKHIQGPLIIGGGMRSPEQARAACRAGADIVVIGNLLEEKPEMIQEMSIAIHAPISVTDKD